MKRPVLLALTAAALFACGPLSADPGPSLPLPYSVERFSLPGPVQGALARIDLGDPRVHVEVALADAGAAGDTAPCVGRMEATSVVARKRGYQIAINASFFATPNARAFDGKTLPYFVGNCGYPEGWHFSGGRLIAAPVKDRLRSTLVVHGDGRVSLEDRLMSLPADTKFAVSGNAMMLTRGELTPPAADASRHPRSAVGISADGRTLFLVAVDGRQEGHSQGVTLAELAKMLLGFGAHSAINLDGGGSTAMAVRDPASGVYALANQPSDQAAAKLPLRVERPVIDVVGVVVD